ncbi:hypothetical protein FZO89_09505 [Luteimonas viscosa]|uniref:Uncharacterized protein n=1 Tax=Luteimonas viscosa TaxID=1132694 RepID=A0A5D4XR92_9GAMM|nr:hypothetical protein [Luteimonas viscosa]TYT26473.1 hypothetical protein FZO89_09505 [Luteimonas viscosa]
MTVSSAYRKAKVKTKAVGAFWLLVCGVLLASSIALYQTDLAKRSHPDPGNLELFASIFNAMLAIPFLICGLALVTGQRNSMRWITVPSYFVLLAAYSLWTTRDWYAA